MPNKGYVKNPKRAEEIIDETLYREFLVKKAEEAETFAKAFAPKISKTHTLKSGYVSKAGDYRRGIKVVIRGKKVYLSATDFKSHWVEWGSVNNPVSAPIRRALLAVGLDLSETEGASLSLSDIATLR